jgi:hypothetical protein
MKKLTDFTISEVHCCINKGLARVLKHGPSNLRHCGTEENHVRICQDTQTCGGELNRGAPEYEVLPSRRDVQYVQFKQKTVNLHSVCEQTRSSER